MSTTEKILHAMPESDKVIAASEESQKIGEFLEWASNNGHIELHERINVMLAKYFGIDLDEVERERRMLLIGIRYDTKTQVKK